jgi:hypothetical protein
VNGQSEPSRYTAGLPSAAAGLSVLQLFYLNPFLAVASRLEDHAVAIAARPAETFAIARGDAVGLSVADYSVNPRSGSGSPNVNTVTVGPTTFGC